MFGRTMRDQGEYDLMALELAAHGLWEYWDVSTVIYHLYLVYRKVELPYFSI